MADKTAARRTRAHHPTVDVQALRAAVRSRLTGRRAAAPAPVIQQHADAVGRGEPSVSPAKRKVGSAR